MLVELAQNYMEIEEVWLRLHREECEILTVLGVEEHGIEDIGAIIEEDEEEFGFDMPMADVGVYGEFIMPPGLGEPFSGDAAAPEVVQHRHSQGLHRDPRLEGHGVEDGM